MTTRTKSRRPGLLMLLVGVLMLAGACGGGGGGGGGGETQLLAIVDFSAIDSAYFPEVGGLILRVVVAEDVHAATDRMEFGELEDGLVGPVTDLYDPLQSAFADLVSGLTDGVDDVIVIDVTQLTRVGSRGIGLVTSDALDFQVSPRGAGIDLEGYDLESFTLDVESAMVAHTGTSSEFYVKARLLIYGR